MKRPLRPEELRLWRVVASTARPFPGKVLPTVEAAKSGAGPTKVKTAASPSAPPARAPRSAPKSSAPPLDIEPNRARRIVLGREEIAARLDLHGMDQDQARAALQAFVLGAQARGARAVLVITGRGSTGDGVLRRRTPEWLSEPPLRAAVAGISHADRRHGGEGALYVALKRKV